MHKFLFACLILTSFCSPELVVAQTGDDDSVVYLKTNMADALVFADSSYVGRASEARFNIPRSVEVIRLVPPRLDSWSILPQMHELERVREDTLYLKMDFPYYYKIESVPYEAQVFLEEPKQRTLLGATPVLHTAADPLRGMLLIVKDGYVPVRLSPGEQIWNQHHVQLELNNSYDDEIVEKYWHPEKRSNRWIDYAAGGIALVSGILAIRYKTKANRRFERYELSGDPDLRSGIEKYDRYAAVSLGVMQAGMGVLAIRFVIN